MAKALAATGLSERFTVSGAETGLHMLLEASPSFDEAAVTNLALGQGLRIYPLSRYCLASKRKGWVLGFAKVDEATIEEGIRRLSALLF